MVLIRFHLFWSDLIRFCFFFGWKKGKKYKKKEKNLIKSDQTTKNLIKPWFWSDFTCFDQIWSDFVFFGWKKRKKNTKKKKKIWSNLIKPLKIWSNHGFDQISLVLIRFDQILFFFWMEKKEKNTKKKKKNLIKSDQTTKNLIKPWFWSDFTCFDQIWSDFVFFDEKKGKKRQKQKDFFAKKNGVEEILFCCPLLQGIFSTQKKIPKPKEKISQTSSAFTVVLGI